MYPVPSNDERWRLLKQYIRHGYMDTDTHLLGKYAEALSLSVPSKISLAFLYSTCYNVPTACFLHDLLGPIKYWNRKQLQDYWDEYSKGMIFQTDRKWVKIANQFVDLCMDFRDQMYPFNEGIKPYINSFDSMYEHFSKLKNQGRVSTYIFIDGLIATGVMKPCMPERFDWNNGQTCTEGMLHALGLDDEADGFDKGKHRLKPELLHTLDSHLYRLVSELRDEGMDEDHVCDYESNLCAYRKYFKGTMYLGYYLDRQLEELRKLQREIPDWYNLWEHLFQLRKEVYPADLLGEIGGWQGIRRDRMKNFLKEGVMDVDY
jgi:hypothetical protein